MNLGHLKIVNTDKKKILVLQGGGIRGVMQRIECQYLQTKIGRPICQHFDLIVGTSTGAIIRSMLAFGVPASQIRNVYIKQGRVLFTPYPWYKRVFSRNMPKYDRSNLLKKVGQIFRDNFGVVPFMGEAKTNLMLTTFGRMSGRTHFIMSWDERHMSLKMVSQASPYGPIRWSAMSAIYYFGQIIVPEYKWWQEFQVEVPGWQFGRVFQDGGQGNNNCPLRQTIITALKLGWLSQQVKILDLGCGEQVLRQPMNDVRNDFLPGQVANFVMQARNQSTYQQFHSRRALSQSLPNLRFFRVRPILTKAQDSLDALDKVDDFIKIGEALKTKIPRQFFVK